MRLLLGCCCCIRAHPPSAQAGRQIKVFFLPLFLSLSLPPSVSALLNFPRRNGRRALHCPLLVSSFHRCPGLESANSRSSQTGARSLNREGQQTAVGLPALQLAQHFSLLTHEPPLNMNTSQRQPFRSAALIRQPQFFMDPPGRSDVSIHHVKGLRQ